MKNLGRNALSMLAVAAITMVASLAVISPRGADAEDSEEVKTAESLVKITPEISTPKLDEDGCSITLKADKETYTEGDKPVLTVSVTNNGKEAIEKEVTVSMVSRSLIEGGRMPAMARVVWTETTTVSLAAGESKSVELTSDAAVAALNSTSFRMSGEKEEVSREARLEKAVKGLVRKPSN